MGKVQTPMSQDRKPLHTLLPLDKPLSLFIDPCDLCNFNCQFCYQSHREKKGQVMTMELFKKIVEDMHMWETAFPMVHLNGFGEPLLNKNIVEFVRILKQEKVADVVSITTNASLLEKELGEQLIEAGLDKLHVSIYGLSDKKYTEFTSKEVSFEKIKKNVELIYQLGHIGENRLHVHVKIAGNYFSEEEQDKFFQLFEPICDTMHIDKAINAWPGIKLHEIEEKDHLYGLSSEKKICPMPFYQLAVHSNGKVSPCCVEFEQGLIMGDIWKKSLKEIWDGNVLKKLQKDILYDNVNPNSVCGRCDYPQCGATVDITPYKKDLKLLYD